MYYAKRLATAALHAPKFFGVLRSRSSLQYGLLLRVYRCLVSRASLQIRNTPPAIQPLQSGAHAVPGARQFPRPNCSRIKLLSRHTAPYRFLHTESSFEVGVYPNDPGFIAIERTRRVRMLAHVQTCYTGIWL